MRDRLQKWFVVSALILTIGAHWAILQSVAWLGMVVTYSQEAPFRKAIQMTFDGNHPCKLCLTVQGAKKSEKKHPTIKLETKLDFFLLDRQVLGTRPDSCLEADFPVFSQHAASRSDEPAIPPPRAS